MALDRGDTRDAGGLVTTDGGEPDDSGANRSYNATLAPSCMLWLMVIGLSLIAIIIVIWGVSNLNRI